MVHDSGWRFLLFSVRFVVWEKGFFGRKGVLLVSSSAPKASSFNFSSNALIFGFPNCRLECFCIAVTNARLCCNQYTK